MPAAARWVLGAGIALSAACSTEEKPRPAPPRKVLEAPGKAALPVTDGDDGARVVLEPTQQLRVELPNSDRAVAGRLEWSVVDLKPGVLGVVGYHFERTQRPDNPTEAAGTSIWQIRPLAAGRVDLTFVLRRPQSLNPAERTVRYDVTVK